MFLCPYWHTDLCIYAINYMTIKTAAVTTLCCSGVSHYFSMDKAKRDIGYCPQQHPFEPVVQWFKDRGHAARKSSAVSRGLLWVLAVLCAAACGLLLLLWPSTPSLEPWAPGFANACLLQ